MNKKFFKLIFLFSLIITSIFAFTACAGEEYDYGEETTYYNEAGRSYEFDGLGICRDENGVQADYYVEDGAYYIQYDDRVEKLSIVAENVIADLKLNYPGWSFSRPQDKTGMTEATLYEGVNFVNLNKNGSFLHIADNMISASGSYYLNNSVLVLEYTMTLFGTMPSYEVWYMYMYIDADGSVYPAYIADREYYKSYNGDKTEYTINYNLNGGTLNNQKTTLHVWDFPYVLPEPTPPNYMEFVSWTTDPEGKNEISVLYEKQGYTLYAQYKDIEYTITYAVGDGTLAETPKTKFTQHDFPYTPIVPTAPYGYTFVGWKYSNSVLTTPGSYNLVAVYELIEYTVEMHCRGEMGMFTTQVTLDYTDFPYTIPTITSPPGGLSFSCWTSDEEGTNQISVLNEEKDYVLYAQYSYLYTITYNLNGGTLNNAKTHLMPVDIPYQVPNPTPPAGKKFVKWTDQSGEEVYLGRLAYPKAYVLYAQYEDTEHTISYNIGDGSLTGQKTKLVQSDFPYTLPTPTAPTGKVFDKWTTDSAGQNTVTTLTQANSYTLYAWYKDEGKLLFRYEESVQGYSVVGYEGEFEHIDIPQYYKGVEVKTIGYEAFASCKMKSIDIPDNIVLIDSYAFYHCENLESITIPDGVKVKGSLFSGCKSLKEVVLPSDLKTIDDTMFCYCESLENIVIPDGVEQIGYGAFWDCSSLNSITIPNSVKEIDSISFVNCIKLTNVTIPASVEEIDATAFSGCTNLKTMYIQSQDVANMADIGKLLQYIDDVYIKSDIEISVSIYNVAYNNMGTKTVDGVQYVHYQIKE